MSLEGVHAQSHDAGLCSDIQYDVIDDCRGECIDTFE